MLTKTLVLPVLAAASCFAAAPPIGIVTASGHFTLDRSEVWGNTTLFDGGDLETGSGSPGAGLRKGVKILPGATWGACNREKRPTPGHGGRRLAAPRE